jgi:transcriptional regulator with XRE-family HTH domain
MTGTAMQQLGGLVRAAREATGLSQAAFAEKAGMDRLYFGRIELGKQNPTVAVLLRIALEAGVDAASLLAGIVVDPDELRRMPRPTRGPRKPPPK